MEKVGERLVEERKRLAKTVAGMAEECAVSKQAQINFEKGRQLPGGAYLIAAARLGVDVSYVLTGQRAGGAPMAPVAEPTQQLSRRALAVAQNYEATSEEGKKIIEAAAFAAAKPGTAARKPKAA